jgi:hypothetical protein
MASVLLALLACGPGGQERRAAPGEAVGDDTAVCEVCDTAGGDTDTADTVPRDSGADTAPDDTTPDDTAITTGPACGDATCAADESCWNCADDCGACDCPTAAEVVIYDAAAWNVLADAFLADPSPCADYYFSIPPYSTDKTNPRDEGEPAAMRARGPRMHAMAEFHWGTWADESGSWYDKGVEFRRRMADAGYDVDAGDTWAVNELPSTVRYDDSVRQDAEDLLQGLYDGPSGATAVKGAVFIVGMGQGTVNFSVYEPYLQDWIQDQSFWESVNLHARWWAQEVYTDPDYSCVPDQLVATDSSYVNAFVEHFARYAEVGPSTANTAQSYLGRAYTPLMTAVWGSSSGYGDTQIPLDQMEHHVSTQVYAARVWADSHSYPDGRIGFAWDRQDGVDDADLEVLAARLASSIHYAYDEGGGGAQYACSPTGAYTWCNCEVDGAAFNDGWSTFESW